MEQRPSELVPLSVLYHWSSREEELVNLSVNNIRRALFGFRTDGGDGNGDGIANDDPVEIEESLLIDLCEVYIGKMIGEGRHSIVYEGL